MTARIEGEITVGRRGLLATTTTMKHADLEHTLDCEPVGEQAGRGGTTDDGA